MDKRLLFVGVLIIAVGILIGWYTSSRNEIVPQISENTVEQTPTISTTATKQDLLFTSYFAIFTNGTFRDFSDTKYHYQSEDVYIASSDTPNLIYFTKEGLTWGDFFETLPSPMSLDENCLTTGTGQDFCTSAQNALRFFINDKELPDALFQEIMPGDKLLVTYGPHEADVSAELERLTAIAETE